MLAPLRRGEEVMRRRYNVSIISDDEDGPELSTSHYFLLWVIMGGVVLAPLRRGEEVMRRCYNVSS